MTLRRSALTIVLAATGLGVPLLAALPAAAAPTWLAPVKLSATGQNAERPQVAVDARGDAVAVWTRLDEETGFYVVEAAGRPAGSGAWQSAVRVSNTGKQAATPVVGVDAAGDAVVAWESFDGAEYAVEEATRTGLSGTWGTPLPLKKLGGALQPGPGLAVDGKGDAVVVWDRTEASKGIVEAAARPASASSWQGALLSEEAEVNYGARVAIDAEGEATAVWEEKEGVRYIAAASAAVGGKWSKRTLVSPPVNTNEARVAVNQRGDVVVAWERLVSEEQVEVATRAAGSAKWSKPVALTEPESGKGEPAKQQVAIDGQGDAVAVWSRLTTTGHDFVEASLGKVSTGTWQPASTLSAPGTLVEEGPAVAVDGTGGALVTWEQPTGGVEVVEGAAGSLPSGAWQTAKPLSDASTNANEPAVAMDEQGNGVAAWHRLDSKGFYIAEAAGYDAAGPLLSSLAVPASGTVGQSLAFSVSPLDVWSALGATSWSFGDGASAAGTAVAHSYGAPGTYTVTVTGADVLGNSTSTHAQVSIAAASTPPSPVAVAPRLTGAHLSRSRFRVGRSSTAISAAKVPQGTSFLFSLTEAAKLQIAFTRPAPGLRSGRRCLAPSARLKRQHAKRCTRTLTVGTLTRAKEKAGAGAVAFSGRLGSRALAPGAYRAILTASANGLSSTPVALSLTIVR